MAFLFSKIHQISLLLLDYGYIDSFENKSKPIIQYLSWRTTDIVSYFLCKRNTGNLKILCMELVVMLTEKNWLYTDQIDSLMIVYPGVSNKVADARWYEIPGI